jgi:hypothetical protein
VKQSVRYGRPDWVARATLVLAMTVGPSHAGAHAPGAISGGRLLVQDTGAVRPRRAPVRLNTLHDIGLALGACWAAHLPPIAEARPGMRVTVMLTFTRSGEVLGEPRFTYITPEAPADTKARYQRAAVDAINSCTPLPFSDGLGNAIAGRPNIFPFTDWRNEKKA